MANINSLDLELSSSQYAYINDTASLSITGDFTIEAWIKLEQLPSTAGTTFTVAGKYEPTGDKASYVLLILATDVLAVLYTADGVDGANRTQINSNVAFDAGDVGAWVHIAVAVDVSAKTAGMYINASPVETTVTLNGSASVQDNASRFAIGALNTTVTPGLFFDGLVDEVRIWNDIRSEAEIVANYQKELVGNEAGLAGYWQLDNDYLDMTANNNDLTASGSPVFSTDVPFVGALGNFLPFL